MGRLHGCGRKRSDKPASVRHPAPQDAEQPRQCGRGYSRVAVAGAVLREWVDRSGGLYAFRPRDRTSIEGSMTARVFQSRRRVDRMQNALLSAAVAMLVWLLTQIMSLSTGVAELNARLPEIEIKASAAYRAADARRDFAELDARIGRLERGRWHEGGTQ